jgi:hypothetical protein
MTFKFNHLVVAAALVVAGSANSAPITVQASDAWNGLAFTGSKANLAFGIEMLAAVDTIGHTKLSPYGAAQFAYSKDSEGYYESATVTGPLSAITIDDASKQTLNVDTSLGVTLTALPYSALTTGGSITLKDLSVDISKRQVFATIIGANGVGTLTNVPLWDIMGTALYDGAGKFSGYDAATPIVGPTAIVGEGSYAIQLNGLKFTPDGTAQFTKALGLQSLGVMTLQGVHDVGTITLSINATATTSTIPEPATPVLMVMGLLGLALVSKIQG